MKKIISLFLVFIIMLTAFTIPIAAQDNNSQEASGLAEILGKIFGEIKDIFLFLFKSGNDIMLSKDKGITIINGGFNYVSNDHTNINTLIFDAYSITYPIGFAIMIISWCLGIAKAGINTAMDFKDKNSLIRAFMSLMIGITALMLAPWLMTVLVGASQSLCETLSITLGTRGVIEEILDNIGGEKNIWMLPNESIFNIIVFLILDLVLMLNILWIALLQCISPLFIAFFGGESTRKLAINFVKEYIIALLIPPVTIVYYALAATLTANLGAFGLIGGIVLGISTLGIASKKLPRLLN